MYLTHEQEQKIKMLLAYYNNNVTLYLKSNKNVQFQNMYDIEDWFDNLPEHLNFKNEILIKYLFGTKDVHDLLMIMVKYLGLKRKNKITDERRKRLHEQLTIIRQKYN
jgi:hypothetical protein